MTAAATFTFDELHDMVGGKVGTHDMLCPVCGPYRHALRNRVRTVLRVWLVDDRFATWHCERCGSEGHARRPLTEQERAALKAGRPVIDSEAIRRARAEAAARDKETAVKRLELAKWLWKQRLAIPGTLVEFYLRNVRGYSGPIPATLGYLPARGDHSPAMIAAYGVPLEPEPGALVMTEKAFRGVQVTRLTDRGEKIPDDAKISIGKSAGSPIVLAPMNDLLGLVLTEGAEDGLSMFEATGLGAWAAGGASRMPALAETVPDYTACVSVVVDDDPAGRKHTAELIARLKARKFTVETIDFSLMKAA